MVQHRTLKEFDWFVTECIFGDFREKYLEGIKEFMNSNSEDVLKK